MLKFCSKVQECWKCKIEGGKGGSRINVSRKINGSFQNSQEIESPSHIFRKRGIRELKIQTFSRRRQRDNLFYLVTTLLNSYILILASS